jgi:hypothetical protein
MRGLEFGAFRRHRCRCRPLDLRCRSYRLRSDFAWRSRRLGWLRCLLDRRHRSWLDWLFDHRRRLGLGHWLDDRCRAANAGRLNRLRLRGLLDRSRRRGGCRGGGHDFRLVHDFGGATTTNRWSWLGFRRRDFGRSGRTAATSGTGDRCGRGGPGALFTLPARTSSRDLIVG